MIPTRRTVDAEKLKQYMAHLPTCNIAQDWTEAEQAMADTPQKFRDFSYNEAYQEMITKKNTCTCGLEELLSTPPIEASAGSMTEEQTREKMSVIVYNHIDLNDGGQSEVDLINELTDYFSSQSKRIEELEKENKFLIAVNERKDIELSTSRKLLSELNTQIFGSFLNACSEQEIKDSYSELEKSFNRVTKFLASKQKQ